MTAKHEITLLNRESLKITGVKDIESFDREGFLLDTEMGFLNIKGQNLHILSLDLEQGKILLEGIIHNIAYLNEKL